MFNGVGTSVNKPYIIYHYYDIYSIYQPFTLHVLVSVEHFLEENTFLIPLGSEKKEEGEDERKGRKGEKEKRKGEHFHVSNQHTLI